MITVILVIHLILALALIGVVLLQKSEGGALGMGGGGMSGFMSGRSTANLLTRTTAILAALFMVTSIVLALLAGQQRAPRSIVDQPATTPGAPAAPQSAPASPPATAPAPAPAAPAEPSPPLAK
jgi:preprotein translocase subunit SecG